jgi:exodeoxyribonuclease-3
VKVALKVCTFNVNSIRTRIDLVTSWLEHRDNDIDVLCLQELKVVDEKFPYEALKQLGFTCEVYGQKQYNGVAICSKLPLTLLERGFDDEYWDQQKRLMAGRVGDLHIINVYVPHGDLRGTDKHQYKLAWYKQFFRFLQEGYTPDQKILVLGDFNVARDDVDVYDPEMVKDAIGTMAEERAAFNEVISWGLIDAFRRLYRDRKGFTWWDYIGGAIWRDEGMRLDYIFCTQPLLSNLKRVEVDLWPRRRRSPTPSDHAPTIAAFEDQLEPQSQCV